MAGSTDIELHWVQSLEEALAFKRWLGERRTWLAVDTETGGLDWWVDRLRTVQFGDARHGWCVEWDRWAGLVIECLREYEGPVAMHNAKFDTHFLEVNAAPVKRWLVHDTRAMAHLLQPDALSGLKPRAARELGPWARVGEDELKLAMMKGGWDWGTVPVELLWRYAAFDTVLTAQLAEHLWPQVHASEGLRAVYGLEIASTQVLCDMERRGILTDRRYLDRAYEEWGLELAKFRHQVRERFLVANPNSNAQVVEKLKGYGWQPLLFTDAGRVKLDDDVLGGIIAGAGTTHAAEAGELAELVLGYREFLKLRGTYAKNLIELADAGGRLHPSINPLGARTGRMSVSRPSLQNLPANDPRIRNAFVSAGGSSLVTADYDQIEFRLFAHYTQDEQMLQAVRYGDWMTEQGHEGYDLHSMNARLVFGIGMDEPVPKQARKKVKGVGFGEIYGAGDETFAATAGITVPEAQEAKRAFHRAFPLAASLGNNIAATLWRRAKETGYPHVVTAYGRLEPCPPYTAYKAVNYLIQGTAADVLKDRLVALSRTWLGQHMLLPIHDEILFEVPDEAVPEAEETIRQVMPERERFAVPLTVGVETVKRWGQKYE